jgi:hypothetical protein
MKRIDYVEDITLTTIHDVPIVQNGKPATMSQYDFMIGRLTDAKLTAPREGLEAIEFKHEVKKELNAQKDTAKARGGWDVEDDRAKALRETILHPTGGYNPEIEHNLLPFVLAARDMRETPRDAKTNGVSAETVAAPAS